MSATNSRAAMSRPDRRAEAAVASVVPALASTSPLHPDRGTRGKWQATRGKQRCDIAGEAVRYGARSGATRGKWGAPDAGREAQSEEECERQHVARAGHLGRPAAEPRS